MLSLTRLTGLTLLALPLSRLPLSLLALLALALLSLLTLTGLPGLRDLLTSDLSVGQCLLHGLLICRRSLGIPHLLRGLLKRLGCCLAITSF